MSNLFSSFDPSSYFSVPFNWVAVFICMLMIPNKFWLLSSKSSKVWESLMLVHKEMEMVFGVSSVPGTTWYFMSIFTFVLINNMMGLVPYVFTSSSHLVFTLAVAYLPWVGCSTWNSVVQPDYAYAHLVPLGTPVALMGFMVVIELVSQQIRPMTLAVRLMANMTAGHLLLTLVSSSMGISLSLGWLSGVVALSMLLVLELGVGFIQAYVFSLLSALYAKEGQTKKMMLF